MSARPAWLGFRNMLPPILTTEDALALLLTYSGNSESPFSHSEFRTPNSEL
jgi:hypothetical protein